MLEATRTAVRSKAAALAGRLAEIVEGAAETLRAAALGLGPAPAPIPVRVRAGRPARGC